MIMVQKQNITKQKCLGWMLILPVLLPLSFSFSKFLLTAYVRRFSALICCNQVTYFEKYLVAGVISKFLWHFLTVKGKAK